jgi:hypothetical protein
MPTLWTGSNQLRATFFAELGGVTVLMLAQRTMRISPQLIALFDVCSSAWYL